MKFQYNLYIEIKNMFVEIFECMRGELKYVHMIDYKMFIDVSSKDNILTRRQAEEYLMEKDFLVLLRTNIYTQNFPNVFSCTFLAKNLYLKNYIFAEYDGQFYKIKGCEIRERTPEQLKEYCMNQFAFATTTKQLLTKILNI